MHSTKPFTQHFHSSEHTRLNCFERLCKKIISFFVKVGTHTTKVRIAYRHTSTEVAIALLIQLPRVRFSAFPKFILDDAEVHRFSFYNGGQWLNNVDRTLRATNKDGGPETDNGRHSPGWFS